MIRIFAELFGHYPNRFGQPGTEVIKADLQTRLETFFRLYATPEYDIWQGGRSKANRVTGK